MVFDLDNSDTFYHLWQLKLNGFTHKAMVAMGGSAPGWTILEASRIQTRVRRATEVEWASVRIRLQGLYEVS